MNPAFKSGQIMLETVMALAVITVGVYAAFTLSIANVNQSAVAINRFIASQLAREGVEIVRSIRDTTWLLPEPSIDVGQPLLNILSQRILKGAIDNNGKITAEPVYAVPFWYTGSDVTECPATNAWCLKFLTNLPTPASLIEKQLGVDLTPVDNNTQICSTIISGQSIYNQPDLSSVACSGTTALPFRRLLKFEAICGYGADGDADLTCTGEDVSTLIGVQVTSFVAVPSRSGLMVYFTPATLFEWR